jgi:hypothetical protein
VQLVANLVHLPFFGVLGVAVTDFAGEVAHGIGRGQFTAAALRSLPAF